MKDSLVNVLEDFEKLAYKILMWVILVPKTVIKIVIDPGFVPGYVHEELGSEKGKQFDEYISPMLLYLGVMLLPAIAIYLMPAFGMQLITPQSDSALKYDAFIDQDGVLVSAFSQPETFLIPVTGGDSAGLIADENIPIQSYTLEFRTEATTKGDTQNNDYRFSWRVSSCGNKAEDGACLYDQPYFAEDHEQNKGITILTKDANGLPILFLSSTPNFVNITEADRNHVSDIFSLGFTPGEYLVTARMEAFESDSPETIVEVYESSLVVNTNLSTPPAVSYNEYQGVLDDELDLNIFGFPRLGSVGGSEETSLAKRLESSETIVLGLLLLLPPLLLAGAIGIFTGSDRSFGEESLKEHFYAQCYYFIPVGMAFWASYYSWNYHTQDIPFPANFLAAPFFLALAWFFVIEIYSIGDSLEPRSKSRGLMILLGCILIMGLVIYLGGQFSRNYDLIRESAIWSYPVVGVLLLIAVIFNQTRKLRRRRKKSAGA